MEKPRVYMRTPKTQEDARRDSARERILAAAYSLFARNGTRGVGIDTIIAESAVAKMSLYRHFRSKQELVASFLERREQIWTDGWLRAEVMRRFKKPESRLLGIFDIFDEWFQAKDFEGCSFINVLLEYPAGDAIHEIAAEYLAHIRLLLKELAEAARLAEVERFCATWHMLMKGSIIAACEGDRDAAKHAKIAAGTLLASWRRERNRMKVGQ